MQMTWGRVGGKPLYVEYQINIGNTNNRVTCPMNYILITSNSYEMSLYTSQWWIQDDRTPLNIVQFRYLAVIFLHRNRIMHTIIISDTPLTGEVRTGFSFLHKWNHNGIRST